MQEYYFVLNVDSIGIITTRELYISKYRACQVEAINTDLLEIVKYASFYSASCHELTIIDINNNRH